MEPKPQTPQNWFLLLAAVVILLAMILVGRSCRNDTGRVPPPLTDTVETDTMMVPPTAPSSPSRETRGDAVVPADTPMKEPKDITPKNINPQGLAPATSGFSSGAAPASP